MCVRHVQWIGRRSVGNLTDWYVVEAHWECDICKMGAKRARQQFGIPGPITLGEKWQMFFRLGWGGYYTWLHNERLKGRR